MDRTFREYLILVPQKIGKPVSLDKLFGCTKKKGQGTAAQDFVRQDRDRALMVCMDTLRRAGMTLDDASRVVYHRLIVDRKLLDKKGHYAISHKKIMTMYSGGHWQERLAKAAECSEQVLALLLKSPPDDIRKKYPALFA